MSLSVTVGWLLSAFSAFAADCCAIAVWTASRWWPSEILDVFKNVTLLIGFVAGVMTLVLMLVAQRVRPAPPPMSVVTLSWAITVAAFVLVFVL